jgi:hypothetical protein
MGVLHGFDRLLFRGSLRSITYARGLEACLGTAGVRFKDFGAFAESLSEALKKHGEQIAKKAGRPYQYISRSTASKEQIFKAIAQRDGIKEGLVCVLRCVEPCMGFTIRRKEAGGFGFVRQERKCLHLYFYYLDRDLGLMHIRLATWLPFGIQVCLNGREYLARQMAKAGIGFEQRDNCFVRIDDLPRAQKMMHELERRHWERVLGALASRVNPLLGRLDLRPYYWSIRESEYATDVMFKDEAALEQVYPALADHAIKRFSSRDAMRFLGRRTNVRFNDEAGASLLKRTEGLRVKHWVEENSIKMYDKQGSVLRIETTLNNVRRFKVRRKTIRRGIEGMRWIPMRMGVVDIDRRVELSRAANERYLEALSVVDVPAPACVLLDQVSRPVVKDARRYRALRPVSQDDAKVFTAVLSGEFLLKGFSNGQIRKRLSPGIASLPGQVGQISGRITRLLRLLRAHGLVRKVSGTRYYRVTAKGHQIMTAALRLRDADVSKLVA